MRKIPIDCEQRMKFNWLVKGNRPTNFIYNKLNFQPLIEGLKYVLIFDGSWSSASEKLANEAIKYFSNLFPSSQTINRFPDITCKKVLSDNAKRNLCKPFEIEEIKNALFQINDNSTLAQMVSTLNSAKFTRTK